MAKVRFTPPYGLSASLRLHKRKGSPRIHPTPQVPSHVLCVQPFSSALSQIPQERQSRECQELLRAERTLMQKSRPMFQKLCALHFRLLVCWIPYNYRFISISTPLLCHKIQQMESKNKGD